MKADLEQASIAQLEMLRWHIIRSDGQRVGIWSRAAAVLGADTLVLAGATVLLTLSPAARQPPKWIALASMILVLLSVARVAQVIGTVKDWAKTVEPESPPPALFNLSESIKLAGTFAEFRKLV